MNYLNKSEQIKAGVIEGFQDGKSKYTMRRCYGSDISKDGSLVMNPKEASTVQWIFQRYLHGDSLGELLLVCRSMEFHPLQEKSAGAAKQPARC